MYLNVLVQIAHSTRIHERLVKALSLNSQVRNIIIDFGAY